MRKSFWFFYKNKKNVMNVDEDKVGVSGTQHRSVSRPVVSAYPASVMCIVCILLLKKSIQIPTWTYFYIYIVELQILELQALCTYMYLMTVNP